MLGSGGARWRGENSASLRSIPAARPESAAAMPAFRQVGEKQLPQEVVFMAWSPKRDLIALANRAGEVSAGGLASRRYREQGSELLGLCSRPRLALPAGTGGGRGGGGGRQSAACAVRYLPCLGCQRALSARKHRGQRAAVSRRRSA